jgi:hypothetical protein
VADRILIAGLLIAVAAGGAVWLHGYKTSGRDTGNCAVVTDAGSVLQRGTLAYVRAWRDRFRPHNLGEVSPHITCATTCSHPSWADPVAIAGVISLVTIGLALILPGLIGTARAGAKDGRGTSARWELNAPAQRMRRKRSLSHGLSHDPPACRESRLSGAIASRLVPRRDRRCHEVTETGPVQGFRPRRREIRRSRAERREGRFGGFESRG